MLGSTEYRTPPEFFAAQHAIHGFNVDAAATPANALVRPDCDRAIGRFYTAETDGTRRDHYSRGDVVWCNPPYSPGKLVDAFVAAAAATSRIRGAKWVMLLNASMTGTERWHQYIWDRRTHRPREGVIVDFLPGRIHFLDADGNLPLDKKGKPQSPRYDNMLVTFLPGP